MKGLTILQPYAALIANESKRYETRGWQTQYRGLVAIHAGKSRNMLYSAKYKTNIAVFSALYPDWENRKLTMSLNDYKNSLTYGAIVAVAELVECWHIVEYWTPGKNGFDLYLVNSNGERKSWAQNCGKEMLFGDFNKGRYAWELRNVKKLSSPIAFSGKQGLWNSPEDIERQIMEVVQ